jgi:hypothetical protein
VEAPHDQQTALIDTPDLNKSTCNDISLLFMWMKSLIKPPLAVILKWTDSLLAELLIRLQIINDLNECIALLIFMHTLYKWEQCQ